LTQQPVKAGVLNVYRGLLQRLVLMGVVVAVAACAALEREPRSSEAIVKERAQARWDALVRSDIEAAYGYLSPGTKSVTSLEQYTKSIRKGFWKSVVVSDAVCKPDSCEVSATMIYEMDGARYKSPYKEKWIREGSDWWYFFG
jgi:hypothetical protein